MNERTNTCCFTGHRKLPQYKIENIIKHLDQEIENLINQGATDFLTGGALGFDLMAAALIISKKQMGKPIRLIFALPCHNHDVRWSKQEKQLLHNLLVEADEIIYVSENFSDDCMKLRNQYMVDRSAYCVCALLYQRSGTSQTVDFAKKNGLKVINVTE